MMNDQMNQVLRGNTLCSDGADHDALRNVLVRPLSPRAMRSARREITAEADRVVEKLVTAGTFDAATDLANHLPVTVVSNLVGLPERGRERMLAWGEGLFNCFGPMNDRTVASFPVLEEMMAYATNEAVPAQACPAMMVDYMVVATSSSGC
jgi:cytochrome P450